MHRVWVLTPKAGLCPPHCTQSSCFKALLRNHLLQEACHALVSSDCPSCKVDCCHICLLPRVGEVWRLEPCPVHLQIPQHLAYAGIGNGIMKCSRRSSFIESSSVLYDVSPWPHLNLRKVKSFLKPRIIYKSFPKERMIGNGGELHLTMHLTYFIKHE